MCMRQFYTKGQLNQWTLQTGHVRFRALHGHQGCRACAPGFGEHVEVDRVPAPYVQSVPAVSTRFLHMYSDWATVTPLAATLEQDVAAATHHAPAG